MELTDYFADLGADYARTLVLAELGHEIAHKLGDTPMAEHFKGAGLYASERLTELANELSARGGSL